VTTGRDKNRKEPKREIMGERATSPPSFSDFFFTDMLSKQQH
jgi:hypothetical protein